uniref:Secreted protein n=1 Tax=Steinernema glaseri TaxID=37863 RepID=A0A1I7ZW80_9BILA
MLLLTTAVVLLLPAASSSTILFGMTCEKTPELYSEWTECLLPGGNLLDLIKSFYNDVKGLGCLLPPKKMMRIGGTYLRNNSHYLDHPLYKRIPSQRCGSCPRRLRCCKRSRSFIAQAYDSELCSGFDSACAIEPLTPEELEELSGKYPNATVSPDGCDVTSYVQAELEILKKGAAFEYVEPLLCQVVGTKLPAVNCVRREDQCLCCCSGFRPNAEGKCVADATDTQFGCQ